MRISDWSSDVCSSDLREVARLRDHRAAGRTEPDSQLARDDLRQRRLAEPRRAIEKHMVERIGARLRRLDENAQILPRRRLPDELDRKSTRLNSSHYCASRMPSYA